MTFMSRPTGTFFTGGTVLVNNDKVRTLHAIELGEWYEETFRPTLHRYMGYEDTISRNLRLRNWYTDEDFLTAIIDVMMIDILGSDFHIADYGLINSMIEAVGGREEWVSIETELYDDLGMKAKFLDDVKHTIDPTMPFLLTAGKLFYFIKE